MAESVEQLVGIDRCGGTLRTLFALELIDLAKFEWRRRKDHEWEVGRWPALELTLLAQPLWRSYRASFAICPFPASDGSVPFILLIAFQNEIDSSDSIVGDTTVSVTTLTRAEAQRDIRICAHLAFDTALWLQLPILEERYRRSSHRILQNLPCMKSLAEIQSGFIAPMAAMEFSNIPAPPIPGG